jgi:hypothetical protein
MSSAKPPVPRWLDQSKNHFIGEIPTNIDCLKTLWYLNLSSKNFTGYIPTAIENEDLDLLLARIEFILESGRTGKCKERA